MSIDDEISDFLCGRLTSAQALAFEARLAEDSGLARRVRLLKAMRAALADSGPAAPPDFKASLKRAARARAASAAPSWVGALRGRFAASPWASGAGAAFAAAAVALAIRSALPSRAPSAPAPTASALRPAAAPDWRDAEASARLSELWADDDGRDGDEI